MATLADYYANVEKNVRSSASEYAKKLEQQKAIREVSGLRIVSSASQGLGELEIYTARTVKREALATQHEILARALLTSVYGLQCQSSVLAHVVSAPFTPVLQDPQERTGTLAANLEKALIATERMNKLLRFVTGACMMTLDVNTRAAARVVTAMKSSESNDIPEELLIQLARNEYKSRALDDIGTFEADHTLSEELERASDKPEEGASIQS